VVVPEGCVERGYVPLILADKSEEAFYVALVGLVGQELHAAPKPQFISLQNMAMFVSFLHADLTKPTLTTGRWLQPKSCDFHS